MQARRPLAETRLKGALLALALHLVTVLAAPLVEPTHDHQGLTEAQWHAANDACPQPMPLEECALLGHGQAKSIASFAVAAPAPAPETPLTAARASDGHVVAPASAPTYPRGPPSA